MTRPPVRKACARRAVKLVLVGLPILITLGVGVAGAQASSFTITEQTDPAGDRAPFTFHVTFSPQPNDVPPPGFAPPADFQLMGGQSRTFTVHKGFYTVAQRTMSGWRLVDVRCDNGNDPDPADAPTINLGAGSATIELSKPEHKSCTFHNARITPPPVAPPPVPPPGTTPTPPGPTPTAAPAPAPASAPGQAVKVTHAVSSRARIVAPKSCVSRRFTVLVSGGHVASVTFFVNGHRVRKLSARRSQRRFTVTLSRPLVVSRIVARVRFTQRATPRTRTLRRTIRRCTPSAVTPHFTG